VTGPAAAQPSSVRETLDSAMERAAALLSAAPSVALACHLNPDPDAIGSMLGMAGALRSRGAEVVCSWANDPMERPGWMALVGDVAPVVEPAAFPEAPEVLVTLDAASLDRLGSLADRVARAGEVVVIDHHVTNPGFGTINVIDGHASSSAEVAYRLIRRMGLSLSDGAAAALYAGIVTDTGRFQYQAATAETLRVAADLRETGFDHAKLAQALYEDGSFAFLRVLAAALERVELVPDAGRGLVWTFITKEDLVRAGASLAETDDLIDVIRTAAEADVACVVKQQEDGLFKVSLRSRGGTDVGAIAAAHGGGGHRLAAGYTSDRDVAGTIEAIVAALRAGPGG
jgi:bifunctional oligoribonuclease and PAP phosphatase NrnA